MLVSAMCQLEVTGALLDQPNIVPYLQSVKPLQISNELRVKSEHASMAAG